ncbi:MAG: ABC transporter permease [Rhodobacteraceae bacterium]|nr:ABC transporter permease [Paracoccaceae bacterium]MBR9820102.1 ABC transporter permease [Paracoccaceae bacterium]
MKGRLNFLIGAALLLVILVMALTATVWTPFDPLALDLRARFLPPGGAHLLGTDEFGRDVLSRLMSGATQSLTVAAFTVGFATLFGTLLGLFSGYVGGTLDRILMVISDAVLAFPGTLLALALLVVMGPNVYGIVLALGIAYTPSMLRIVRGTVMSLREREFIEASHVIGNSEWATMLRHVLPNCIAPITVLATSMFGWVILAESGLSFLGLGVPPPQPTWGNMLSTARDHIDRAVWLGIFPGLCISATLLGVILLGDGLRDRFDPRTENT